MRAIFTATATTAIAAFMLAATMFAQVQMPDLKQVSGQPLPSSDVPVGTITVRVIRGSLANNIVGQAVEMSVDGQKRTLTTDANGRVELPGLKPGAHVKAVTVVNGERVESQDITIGSSGIRVMLVATDPDATKREVEDKTLAAGQAIKGLVVFGPESRIVAELAEDRLNVYYLFDISNTARSPVDIGGPLIVDLPSEARGAGLMQDSSKQASVNGARVIVLGPFAPGTTPVKVGFELPYEGATARISSKVPTALPQVIVVLGQTGGLGLASPQITAKRDVTDQGERILVGTGPGLQAGQTLVLDVTGLPHHAVWPRYTALALAGGLLTAGIWAAVLGRPRRRAA